MGKHLVLVGGGHAHLTCLKELKQIVGRGHRVTVISLGGYHYYSGMGPGMLGGTYAPREIRFNVKRMTESAGGDFITGAVTRVDGPRRLLYLASGQEIGFDVASFNTGSSIPLARLTVQTDAPVFPVKPIENLLKAQAVILDLLKNRGPRILVAGGGPAGLEIAANAWRLVDAQKGEVRITLLAGQRFLHNFPDKVRRLALQSLTARNLEVVEGAHLRSLEGEHAVLDNGHKIPFDLTLLALGVKPSPLFADSGLAAGPDGGMLVNEYLQAVDCPYIFGGGDCISFQPQPLAKVGVYAVRQNPILMHNLLAALEGEKLVPFDPGGAYLLIFNLGDGKGIFWKKSLVWDGRLAFWLKDYIDRKFMRKFQVSGELQED
jgi:NADH dehydrogenase FAD-containing subunit